MTRSLRLASVLWTYASLALVACGPPARPGSAETTQQGGIVQFGFTGPGGEHVSTSSVQGRATALVFFTTYDIPSQVQLRRLNDILHSAKPRINAAAVLLEAPKYALLVDSYKESLGLDFPVVMADFQTLERRGPFGYVDKVPTTVVLNYEGREVWRYAGVSEVADLEQALRAGSRPGLGGGGQAPPSSF